MTVESLPAWEYTTERALESHKRITEAFLGARSLNLSFEMSIFSAWVTWTPVYDV